MKQKILIVEDEAFLRKVIADECRENGYLVDEAVDGKEALQKTKTDKFDLILLDLLLPDIDGFEVLTQLKKESTLSGTPVVILSNLGQREEIEKGLSLGAKDYLIKAHVTPSEIIKRIQEILESTVK